MSIATEKNFDKIHHPFMIKINVSRKWAQKEATST